MIAGATWAVCSKLSSIENALLTHVADCKVVQAEHGMTLREHAAQIRALQKAAR
ncbi:hypothetical protein AKJ09_11509 [Labilithrix luteola]|nr:hypothetical protein [Labilithrix luteola]AKV04846.1 hypothetical protein AKJ09_11509 [Labilithrix luteola]